MINYYSQVNLNKIPIKGFVAEGGAAPPSNPAVGQQWTDTSTSPPVVKYWNGIAWVRMDGGDLPDGSVTNSKIVNGTIALNKLAIDPTDRANHHGTQPPSTITGLDAYIRAFRLDQFASPANPLDLGNQRATNAAHPQADTDLATKKYVDDARAGISVKDPVRVVVTGNINLSAPGGMLDGVTMNIGDRFLAAGQTTGTENGLYVFQGPSTPATRAPDADAAGEVIDGTLVAVADGTHAGEQWIQTATPTGAPGTWVQTWTRFSMGGQTYSAGNGLNLAGTVFSVKPGNSTIVVDESGVKVGLVGIAQGGTGATTASGARANLGATGLYTAPLPALSPGVWTNIVHNLGNPNPLEPSFRDITTGEFVSMDSRVIDANTVAVRADVAVQAGAIQITVVG